MFLLELDRGLQALTLLLTRFGIELHQHLTRRHRLPLLHQDLLNDTAHGHLNVLNGTHRFQLTSGDHDFFGSSQGQPSHTEHRGTNQAPGHGAHPETTLLQNRLVVNIEIGRVLLGAGIKPAQQIPG